MSAEHTTSAIALKPVKPIERTEFWDFNKLINPADHEVKYPEFSRIIQKEASIQVERISQKLARFFSVPSEYLEGTLPPIYITDTVAGSTAAHNGNRNIISLPIKYALPLYLGQTNYFRQTELYPTIAHEVGHYIQLTSLNQGDTDKFENSYYQLEPVALEFFARICDRIICDDMKIDRKKEARSDYNPTDEHIGIALADEHYEEIKNLSPQERQRLAFDFNYLMSYIDPQVISDRELAIEKEWEERRRRKKR